MCMDTGHGHRQSPYPHHGYVYAEHCVLKAVQVRRCGEREFHNSFLK